MTGYELHPLCTLFPRMAGSEFSALCDDIKINGLRYPITLHKGMIVDGGNRYRACLDAGVEPTFEEFTGDNLVSFVLSANLHRRHMTIGQQAAIVASAQDWAKAQIQGGDRKSSAHGEHLIGDTTANRAEQSGASVATQRRADAVSKADPELAKQVAHGEVSLTAAVKSVAPQLDPHKHQPKPAKVVTVTTPDPDEPTESEQTQDAIDALIEENESLRSRLAVEQMDASEEGKAAATELIAELRARIKTLEAELSAVKSSRDHLQRTNSEMLSQMSMQRNEIAKLKRAA